MIDPAEIRDSVLCDGGGVSDQLPTVHVNPSPTADTRTCDPKSVSKETLLDSTRSHQRDVTAAMGLFSQALVDAAGCHDHDKVSGIDQFHADFVTGFKQHSWWDSHRKVNRHHIDKDDGVPEDVNLIDVLEHVADCVVAGMARSGDVYDLDLPDEVLRRAFKNTVDLLKSHVEVGE